MELFADTAASGVVLLNAGTTSAQQHYTLPGFHGRRVAPILLAPVSVSRLWVVRDIGVATGGVVPPRERPQSCRGTGPVGPPHISALLNQKHRSLRHNGHVHHVILEPHLRYLNSLLDLPDGWHLSLRDH